jgi:dimeric dUTPase (all-alpha-NTP-PPase superfamily)
MLVDLTDIFEMQIKLDRNIHQNHGVTYQIVIEEIKLALLVELGELANEVRCFKFWSNKTSSDKQTILEEYVDGIHFLTSMCLREHIPGKFEITNIHHVDDKKQITKLFNNLLDLSKILNTTKDIIY